MRIHCASTRHDSKISSLNEVLGIGFFVRRIDDGQIAEITTFSPALLHGFDLPPTLGDR